jgi:hypothetical protein
VVVDTHVLDWKPSSIPGVAEKALYQQASFQDATRLERWESRTDLGTITYEQGAELFVLAGGFADDAGVYSAGCWMRLPAGSEYHPRSAGGCTLYIKTAGLTYLRPAAA